MKREKQAVLDTLNGPDEPAKAAIKDFLRAAFDEEHEGRHPDYVGGCPTCTARAQKKCERYAREPRR